MTILKIISSIVPFEDFLYLLQLEEYYSRFYQKTATRKLFARNFQVHDTLHVTGRIQTTGSIAFLFWLFSPMYWYLFISQSIALLVIFSILTTLAIPYWILAANYLLTPIYNKFRASVQKKAQQKFQAKYSQSCVIAIAGSYGKTTTKNFLTQVLTPQFRVAATPGNINTPTGIASWIMKLQGHYDILIVEMDAYEQGEITKSTAITPPDIAIVTSIGDQHLMRFGTQKKLAETLFEVVATTKQDGAYILSPQAQSMLKKYMISDTTRERIALSKTIGKTNIQSKTARESLIIAVTVARRLKVREDFLSDSILYLTLPDRRQKVTTKDGFDVIDDSYNISPTTAEAAIVEAQSVKRRLKKKKIIVITGGIPELGIENKEANTTYGTLLNDSVDRVILLSTTVSTDIAKKLTDVSHISAARASEAWEIIKKEEDPKDVLVVIQPELTDVYY